MTSYSTKYRKEHPEIYARQQEQKKIRYQTDEEYRQKAITRKKERYENDPEYRELYKQKALDRYYKIKEMKANESIKSN